MASFKREGIEGLMTGKGFVSGLMALDGFIAPESIGGVMSPQWMQLHQWALPLRFFREKLKLREGDEKGRDNGIARETFGRTGAKIIGKRMFDTGEGTRPEEAQKSGGSVLDRLRQRIMSL